jgi:5-methylcytosine-specific restriction endonuclease McrA
VPPCRARQLLRRSRAVVVRRYPFVIRLKYQSNQALTQPIAIKVDPGAKTTGIAVVRVSSAVQTVIHLAEVIHRGESIKERLLQRRIFRRNRRSRRMRYRGPRFHNRLLPKGWLPPSLQSRVDNVISWVQRYRRWVPVEAIVVETVRFDTQKVLMPEISGAEYQQGTLYGYEVREYLLEKFNRSCVYCGSTNAALEIDHVHPRSRGGTDRCSNLVLSCHRCNQAKGNQPLEAFLAKDPDRLERIRKQLEKPLQATAAVNSTRTKILKELCKIGLPLEVSTGGKTRFNRARLCIPKSHAFDAACAGDTPALRGWNMPVLAIKATGRGSYRPTRLDKFGFPRGYLLRQKSVKGFKTGDMVRARVTSGKKSGAYIARVAILASGSFNLQTSETTIQGVGHKYCRLIQRADGYHYFLRGKRTANPCGANQLVFPK